MAQSVQIESISALTLATRDMAKSVAFYNALGFDLAKGGAEAPFTTYRAGAQYLNLTPEGAGLARVWWGRAIFYVSDVDAMFDRAVKAGLKPEFAPRDAPWGERYFHLRDPDGHELSFARPL